jgi:hypothetical protein
MANILDMHGLCFGVQVLYAGGVIDTNINSMITFVDDPFLYSTYTYLNWSHIAEHNSIAILIDAVNFYVDGV